MLVLPESCLVERGKCCFRDAVSSTLIGRASCFVLLCHVCPREEIEKQKSKERYMKLHLEGKTEQARADLARLAIIKKQREEAAKKRDDIKKGKHKLIQ